MSGTVKLGSTEAVRGPETGLAKFRHKSLLDSISQGGLEIAPLNLRVHPPFLVDQFYQLTVYLTIPPVV